MNQMGMGTLKFLTNHLKQFANRCMKQCMMSQNESNENGYVENFNKSPKTIRNR